MLKVAERLAKPFPVVRVDLYNINGKIYFGEMTFTSLGGLMNYYTDEFQNIAGRLIELWYYIKIGTGFIVVEDIPDNATIVMRKPRIIIK